MLKRDGKRSTVRRLKEDMTLFSKAGFYTKKPNKRSGGRLIFEVYYSNAKDDCFKLHTQKEGSYILEVNAKEFYGDGRENLTVERLRENSRWVW